MMKGKTIVSVLNGKSAVACGALFCLSVSAFAHPVDSVSAKAKAVELFIANGVKEVSLERVLLTNDSSAGAKWRSVAGSKRAEQASDLFYIYNNVYGKGFAIISADDALPAVLGYSFSGNASEDSMPDALLMYLSEVANCTSVSNDISGQSDSVSVRVAPLLSTQWGQGSPFNDLCPNKWPVGCVATAMAQIMRYWQWPNVGRGTNTYKYGETYDTRLTVDFSQSAYDWSVMDDVVNLRSSNQCKENVARISYDCGVAVNMEYTKEGSGAFQYEAMAALVKNFSYSSSSIGVIYRDYCESDELWRKTIEREIEEKRPVLFCATSETSGGHCFVLDGLDERGYVHVNWGWSGSYDGFFNLNLLNPGSNKFRIQQRAVYGIVPDKTGEDNAPIQSQMLLEGNLACGWKNRALGTEFSTSVSEVYNYDDRGRTYSMAIGLYSINSGELLQIISNNAEETQHFGAWYGIESKSFTCKLDTDNDYSERYYVMKFVTKQSGFEKWVTPLAAPNCVNTIYVDVHDGKAYFSSEPPVSVEATIKDCLADKVLFYDLQGRKLTSPAKGSIVVKHITLPDGTVETGKFLVR